MNGIEGIGRAGFINRVPHVTGTQSGQPTANQDRRPAGMEGAMKLSGDFLKQTMAEIGFIDIHAGGIDKVKTFVRHASGQKQEVEIGLDPVTAAEMATLAGAQIMGDADQALRIQAQVDPARVAALLK
jgi:hypothetical protein